jgi:hypothetical protein
VRAFSIVEGAVRAVPITVLPDADRA